jgi:purine nucleoside phosphorylase
VVGMTCAHEATLSKEMGLPYCVVTMVIYAHNNMRSCPPARICNRERTSDTIRPSLSE